MSGNGMAKGGAAAPPLALIVTTNPASACGCGNYLRRSRGFLSLGPGYDNGTKPGYAAVLVNDSRDRQCDLGHQAQLVGFVIPHLNCIIRSGAVVGVQNQQVSDVCVLPA